MTGHLQEGTSLPPPRHERPPRVPSEAWNDHAGAAAAWMDGQTLGQPASRDARGQKGGGLAMVRQNRVEVGLVTR